MMANQTQTNKNREYSLGNSSINNKQNLDSLFIQLNSSSYCQNDNMSIYNFCPCDNMLL
jgi:hypothetical protein